MAAGGARKGGSSLAGVRGAGLPGLSAEPRGTAALDRAARHGWRLLSALAERMANHGAVNLARQYHRFDHGDVPDHIEDDREG